MKIAGIIAEYNPFHNGHKYQIEKTREAGATHIVAVMSGSCVQRGEIALCDKHTRAGAAIKGGADLVLELPVPFCLGTAPDFAKAGAEIFKRLGCIDMLSFGSESGDVNELIALANQIESLCESDIKSKMAQGLTYPAAISSLLGKSASKLLNGANNTLAIEYLRAIKNTQIAPFTIKRTTPHDSDELSESFASASYIREVIRGGGDASSFTPLALTKHDVTDTKNIESAVLYRLAMMTKNDFANVPYTDELETRLFEASRTAGTLNELYEKVKTKNITHARVRRAVMLAALGVTKEDMALNPYARILAMNTRGTEILSKCKQTSQIAVSASLAALSQTSADAKRLAQLDELSSRLLHLALNEKGEYISEFSRKFEILK
ncbi:MAG: nucleotidyltransferase family protein [Oscillospiraceae bacterium]|nr:nucleotidyltransferase family protein [Oscillospiraceae bacterium]